METRRPFQRLCRVQIQRLLVLVITLVVALIVLSQLTASPYKNYTAIPSPITKGVLVHKVAIYNDSSIPQEDTPNESKVEERCQGHDCNYGSLVSKVTSKGNNSGQNVAVGSKPTRLAYMISVLESAHFNTTLNRKKKDTAIERQLQHARIHIETGPTLKSNEGLHVSLYRNISRFLRSYKLMEETLKVYIYKEGIKPIYHDPKLRGIYASEGWFMKLMEKNRNFVVKDPKKAHLFYLPFSSLKLRLTPQDHTPQSRKNLELHLKNYTNLISRKYPFWNRTNGADHFLVACHDWAMKITREHMGNCIRSLCNSNLAGGFTIGKDTTLPATYIRTAEDPVKDLGGNPPLERPILAFFAGGMHGNLRPVLLRQWQGKEPDMKIIGPMARDDESKAKYRTYMKSSKYCICARGYEVFTPRIVESIYYECVPVIISDNYVPPFFEFLDWEGFSVFVLEKDVGNLNGILRGISDEKYREMWRRVKMVQRHFIWHKKPVKFDLFHMILHSIWNNRINGKNNQPRPRYSRGRPEFDTLPKEQVEPKGDPGENFTTQGLARRNYQSHMKRYALPFHFVRQIDTRRWLLIVALVASIHLFCQTRMLPYGTVLLSLLPGHDNTSYFTHISTFSTLKHELQEDNLEFEEDIELGEVFTEESSDQSAQNQVESGRFVVEDLGESRHELLSVDLSTNLPDTVSVNSSISNKEVNPNVLEAKSMAGFQARILPINEKYALFQSDDTKKMKCLMPPKSVMYNDQMNRLLVRHRTSSRAMRPRWSSPRDQEILASKIQITKAPSQITDKELYAPVFRNVSMFKRSYELMERTLKVYVYKDGEKPIFHQPILKGLYASEGWFMKLMEGNKRFVVKDPLKAHLFYMPFSARMLEHSLYVRNSHNRTNLRQFLKIYSEKIAAKYPFWNRTGGADHFLVACHDWAPYETRHHMEHCMKALCNADVTAGFKIGRDVSLPECYVRSARNPLRDLGGKPPSDRHILAFYAGNIHGYLRKILLEYWNHKDPDMKILGPMPPGVASKMTYIEHMKSSKFCICPKGYEVNSPRVVEAIFYECVPVIISDNFVPPFFEVLNWDGFSVIIAEKDIPDLKNILMGISEERYRELQYGVRKVQRHFLWHVKPVRYDLFHMVLHSIWYNRVFQIKPR
ncbi:hypothetical protein LXL04_002513 [Taraxacum kok-saghyz]